MRATRFPTRASGVADRMAGFMAHLRLNGLPAGLLEAETALRALERIAPTDPGEVRLALKAICATDADRRARFDELFDAYWLDAGRVRHRPAQAADSSKAAPRQTSHLTVAAAAESRGTADAPENSGDGEADMSGEGRLVASRLANLRKTDLRALATPEELAAAETIAFRLARAMRDRRSRRREAARRGAQLDLRRIARHSVARGGEPLVLLRKRRPDRPVHIVAMLDVSGSMTVYARVLLSFVRGLTSADSRTDAYLFHTRLVRISDALRDHDTLRAAGRMSMMAEGFGGGTRIGANLKAFNEQYARHGVGGRSVVLILSDGYDTDPPELIDAALARLQKRGCRIVWLNPLKGWKDYAPVARGMAAALPHLDLFAAAATLDDLAALEPVLAGL
ncbi:hypothetical protein RHIZO_05108 [Rhizobiaceae bacterium]|nr:hypothetical protein RHIZO_05108 [Rhizobiaceae bacterium]